MDEQVNMFGHVDKTNQEKALRNHGIVNALRQKTSTLVIIEQGQTVVTREGQFVNMAGQITMVHLFTMAGRSEHGGYYNIIFTTGWHWWTSHQWHPMERNYPAGNPASGGGIIQWPAK
jgi:hypothetical protein